MSGDFNGATVSDLLFWPALWVGAGLLLFAGFYLLRKRS